MNPIDETQLSTREHIEYSLGLTGYPLGHSRSPKIHIAALDALNLKGTYRLYPLHPIDARANSISKLVDRIRVGKILGLNITIPYKQRIMSYTDDLTPTARAIGAVNTIFIKDGKLIGDNTDGPGFWVDLNRRLGILGKAETNALILGAGGSARAVAFMLLKAGLNVIIAARRESQTKEVLSQFPDYADRISVQDIRSLEHLDPQPDLVVNTTPVGMQPRIHASPWPENVPLPENAAFYDLVYNPIETKLVKAAREKGHEAATGLGMLVEQAALSFERWTGLTAPRDVMMDAAYE